LNEWYLGCQEEQFTGTKKVQSACDLPLTYDFIRSQNLLSFLTQLHINTVCRVIDNIDPCKDTVSVARNGSQIKMPDFWNVLRLTSNEYFDVPTACWFLNTYFQNEIVGAGPDFYIGMFSEPNDTWFKNTQSLSTLHSSQRTLWRVDYSRLAADGTRIENGINAEEAWDFTLGDPSIKIGIVDKGIDDHADFLTGGGSIVAGGKNFINASQLYRDTSGHGTMVASIVGALRNNGLTINPSFIAGIAGGNEDSNIAGSSVYALKIFDRYSYYNPATGQGVYNKMQSAITSRAFAAIVEGSANSPGGFGFGCDILNHSWGLLPPLLGSGITSYTPNDAYQVLLRIALGFSYLNNVINVAASGNDHAKRTNGDQFWEDAPAGVEPEWVIRVGSSDSLRNLSYFSIIGGNVDVLAPGGEQFSLALYVDINGIPTKTWFTGTSASAPHVSGSAALILSEHLKQKPNLPSFLVPEDVEGLLIAGADGLQRNGVVSGYSNERGYGLINIYRSLEYMQEDNSQSHTWFLHHWKTSFPSYEDLIYDTTFALPIYPIDRYTVPSITLKADTFYVERYIAEKCVPYPKTYDTVRFVWGRGYESDGSSFAGWGAWKRYSKNASGQPLMTTPYTKVTQYSQSSCCLTTYVYRIRDKNNPSNWTWAPRPPNQIKLYYSVLGRVDTILTSTEYLDCNIPKKFFVSAFPNPVSERLYTDVKLNAESVLRIELFDQLGRTIALVSDGIQLPGVYRFSTPVTSLLSGIYFLRVSAGKEHFSKVIFIAH